MVLRARRSPAAGAPNLGAWVFPTPRRGVTCLRGAVFRPVGVGLTLSQLPGIFTRLRGPLSCVMGDCAWGFVPVSCEFQQHEGSCPRAVAVLPRAAKWVVSSWERRLGRRPPRRAGWSGINAAELPRIGDPLHRMRRSIARSSCRARSAALVSTAKAEYVEGREQFQPVQRFPGQAIPPDGEND
jgi:hypothetical protein